MIVELDIVNIFEYLLVLDKILSILYLLILKYF